MSEQTPHNDDQQKEKAPKKVVYNKEFRGSDGIGVGLTFIFIGVVWMMSKLGYINFSIIGSIVALWPLIFVVIGVNIIFKKVPYIGLITWVAFLSAIIAYGLYFAPQDNWISWHDDSNSGFVTNVAKRSDSIPVEGNEEVKEGYLTLDIAAGDLNMGSSSSSLIDYVIPKDYVTVDSKLDGDTAQLRFQEKKNGNIGKLKGNGMSYDFYLNDQVLWFIDVNAGAVDSEMNFANVPIGELEINGGAGDFQLELGELQDKSDVSINMAAGEVNLTVPKNVGIRISTNGLISDHNFKEEGLEKVDGHYQTTDFASATKVIFVEINSAVSDLTLIRK